MTESLKIKTVKVIDESEFSSFVSNLYGRPYRLQQQGDFMSNDSLMPISIPNDGHELDEDRLNYRKKDNWLILPTFQEWLDQPTDQPIRDPAWDLYREIAERTEKVTTIYTPEVEPGNYKYEMIWHRDFYPPLGEVLTDLHNRGFLEEGEYQIHTWW